MMLHIRVDQNELNSDRRFACGIGPALPDGDQWVYASESMAARADCLGCNPSGPLEIGTLASRLDGNAMNAKSDPEAWAEWVRLSNSWGYP